MTLQNITLRLEKKLLETVRMLAASRDLSVSELFAEFVRRTVAQDAAFRARRKRFRDRLKKGLDLGSMGKLSLTRAELHER
ncbi:MAG: ribbon-helix-helix protein, CopG family [Planctomycetes bacterium]|nr:ribbon-helix-helix protein, CopG family [Planctomycetota bacterium]